MVVVLALLSTLAPMSEARSTVSLGDCGWFAKADPDRVNIAWPDEGAQYWAANYALVPGTKLVLTGQFPRGRYLSFHAYEGSAPIDGIADVAISPTSGVNPFVERAKRDRRGTYEVLVSDQGAPADGSRAPDTLYAGRGLNGEPVRAGIILYRVYLPEGDAQGEAPLPRLEYRDAVTGATITFDGSCDTARDGGGTGVVNDTVKASSFPADSPGVALQAPTWGVARSRPQPNHVGPATVYSGNVFFANFDNEYLSLLVGRNAADVVAIRAKAPTFPDTTGAKRMGSGEVRFWSFCSNDFPTTRYVGCVADEDAILDADGYVTIVISDPTHKPVLRPTDNWLPAGPYEDFFVLYRHMLPSPSFAHAIQRIPTANDIRTTMGEYYPTPVACSSKRFSVSRCGLP